MKLTGSELIAKRVIACGYFSTSKNGKKRKNYNAYYKAIAEAQGYKSTDDKENSIIGKGGRKLSYKAKVQGNGNLLIGKAYTALLDLKAGDNFEIQFKKKGKVIRLLPTEKS